MSLKHGTSPGTRSLLTQMLPCTIYRGQSHNLFSVEVPSAGHENKRGLVLLVEYSVPNAGPVLQQHGQILERGPPRTWDSRNRFSYLGRLGVLGTTSQTGVRFDVNISREPVERWDRGSHKQ